MSLSRSISESLDETPRSLPSAFLCVDGEESLLTAPDTCSSWGSIASPASPFRALAVPHGTAASTPPSVAAHDERVHESAPLEEDGGEGWTDAHRSGARTGAEAALTGLSSLSRASLPHESFGDLVDWVAQHSHSCQARDSDDGDFPRRACATDAAADDSPTDGASARDGNVAPLPPAFSDSDSEEDTGTTLDLLSEFEDWQSLLVDCAGGGGGGGEEQLCSRPAERHATCPRLQQQRCRRQHRWLPRFREELEEPRVPRAFVACSRRAQRQRIPSVTQVAINARVVVHARDGGREEQRRPALHVDPHAAHHSTLQWECHAADTSLSSSATSAPATEGQLAALMHHLRATAHTTGTDATAATTALFHTEQHLRGLCHSLGLNTGAAAHRSSVNNSGTSSAVNHGESDTTTTSTTTTVFTGYDTSTATTPTPTPPPPSVSAVTAAATTATTTTTTASLPLATFKQTEPTRAVPALAGSSVAGLTDGSSSTQCHPAPHDLARRMTQQRHVPRGKAGRSAGTRPHPFLALFEPLFAFLTQPLLLSPRRHGYDRGGRRGCGLAQPIQFAWAYDNTVHHAIRLLRALSNCSVVVPANTAASTTSRPQPVLPRSLSVSPIATSPGAAVLCETAKSLCVVEAGGGSTQEAQGGHGEVRGPCTHGEDSSQDGDRGVVFTLPSYEEESRWLPTLCGTPGVLPLLSLVLSPLLVAGTWEDGGHLTVFPDTMRAKAAEVLTRFSFARWPQQQQQQQQQHEGGRCEESSGGGEGSLARQDPLTLLCSGGFLELVAQQLALPPRQTKERDGATGSSGGTARVHMCALEFLNAACRGSEVASRVARSPHVLRCLTEFLHRSSTADPPLRASDELVHAAVRVLERAFADTSCTAMATILSRSEDAEVEGTPALPLLPVLVALLNGRRAAKDYRVVHSLLRLFASLLKGCTTVASGEDGDAMAAVQERFLHTEGFLLSLVACLSTEADTGSAKEVVKATLHALSRLPPPPPPSPTRGTTTQARSSTLQVLFDAGLFFHCFLWLSGRAEKREDDGPTRSPRTPAVLAPSTLTLASLTAIVDTSSGSSTAATTTAPADVESHLQQRQQHQQRQRQYPVVVDARSGSSSSGLGLYLRLRSETSGATASPPPPMSAAATSAGDGNSSSRSRCETRRDAKSNNNNNDTGEGELPRTPSSQLPSVMTPIQREAAELLYTLSSHALELDSTTAPHEEADGGRSDGGDNVYLAYLATNLSGPTAFLRHFTCNGYRGLDVADGAAGSTATGEENLYSSPNHSGGRSRPPSVVPPRGVGIKAEMKRLELRAVTLTLQSMAHVLERQLNPDRVKSGEDAAAQADCRACVDEMKRSQLIPLLAALGTNVALAAQPTDLPHMALQLLETILLARGVSEADRLDLLLSIPSPATSATARDGTCPRRRRERWSLVMEQAALSALLPPRTRQGSPSGTNPGEGLPGASPHTHQHRHVAVLSPNAVALRQHTRGGHTGGHHPAPPRNEVRRQAGLADFSPSADDTTARAVARAHCHTDKARARSGDDASSSSWYPGRRHTTALALLIEALRCCPPASSAAAAAAAASSSSRSRLRQPPPPAGAASQPPFPLHAQQPPTTLTTTNTGTGALATDQVQTIRTKLKLRVLRLLRNVLERPLSPGEKLSPLSFFSSSLETEAYTLDPADDPAPHARAIPPPVHPLLMPSVADAILNSDVAQLVMADLQLLPARALEHSVALEELGLLRALVSSLRLSFPPVLGAIRFSVSSLTLRQALESNRTDSASRLRSVDNALPSHEARLGLFVGAVKQRVRERLQRVMALRIPSCLLMAVNAGAMPIGRPKSTAPLTRGGGANTTTTTTAGAAAAATTSHSPPSLSLHAFVSSWARMPWGQPRDAAAAAIAATAARMQPADTSAEDDSDGSPLVVTLSYSPVHGARRSAANGGAAASQSTIVGGTRENPPVTTRRQRDGRGGPVGLPEEEEEDGVQAVVVRAAAAEMSLADSGGTDDGHASAPPVVAVSPAMQASLFEAAVETTMEEGEEGDERGQEPSSSSSSASAASSPGPRELAVAVSTRMEEAEAEAEEEAEEPSPRPSTPTLAVRSEGAAVAAAAVLMTTEEDDSGSAHSTTTRGRRMSPATRRAADCLPARVITSSLMQEPERDDGETREEEEEEGRCAPTTTVSQAMNRRRGEHRAEHAEGGPHIPQGSRTTHPRSSPVLPSTVLPTLSHPGQRRVPSRAVQLSAPPPLPSTPSSSAAQVTVQSTPAVVLSSAASPAPRALQQRSRADSLSSASSSDGDVNDEGDAALAVAATVVPTATSSTVQSRRSRPQRAQEQPQEPQPHPESRQAADAALTSRSALPPATVTIMNLPGSRRGSTSSGSVNGRLSSSFPSSSSVSLGAAARGGGRVRAVTEHRTPEWTVADQRRVFEAAVRVLVALADRWNGVPTREERATSESGVGERHAEEGCSGDEGEATATAVATRETNQQQHHQQQPDSSLLAGVSVEHDYAYPHQHRSQQQQRPRSHIMHLAQMRHSMLAGRVRVPPPSSQVRSEHATSTGVTGPQPPSSSGDRTASLPQVGTAAAAATDGGARGGASSVHPALAGQVPSPEDVNQVLRRLQQRPLLSYLQQRELELELELAARQAPFTDEASDPRYPAFGQPPCAPAPFAEPAEAPQTSLSTSPPVTKRSVARQRAEAQYQRGMKSALEDLGGCPSFRHRSACSSGRATRNASALPVASPTRQFDRRRHAAPPSSLASSSVLGSQEDEVELVRALLRRVKRLTLCD